MTGKNLLSVLPKVPRTKSTKRARFMEFSHPMWGDESAMLRLLVSGHMTIAMKANSPAHLKFLPVLFVAMSSILAACSGKQESQSPVGPMAPGTVEPSGSGASGVGSFQGPILNASGVIQAILTLDVWSKDGQTNAQITVSPNGATSLISLNEGNQSFAVQLPAKTFGPKARVSITGAWNGSAWKGRLSNDAQSTGSFSLTPGASSQSAIGVGVPSGTFDGQLIFASSGGTRGVSLTIAPSNDLGDALASNDLGDALASTLSTRVALSAYLKYSNGQRENLEHVVWDRGNSTFSADGTVPTSLGTTVVRCQLSEMNSDNRDVLHCTLTSSKTNSLVASGALSQKLVVVAPPYPVPPVQAKPVESTPAQANPVQSNPAPQKLPSVPPPAPTPSIVIKNTRDFEGAGVFTGEDGQTQTRKLTLTVTLASEPTGQTQKAKVKFIIGGSRVGANFIDSTFNSGTGELVAKELLVLGALAGQLELNCGGIQFNDPHYDFMCHYESSVTNVTGEFHLKSVQP
jgi:hypothetical protein